MNDETMEDLKRRFPEIFAVVELVRDGTPLSFLIPQGVHLEIFSIMCATLMGAAGTATSEVGGQPPETAIAVAGSTSILVVAVDGKRLLACALRDSTDTDAVLQAMKEAAKES